GVGRTGHDAEIGRRRRGRAGDLPGLGARHDSLSGLPLLAKWETVSGGFGGLSHRPLEPLAGRCVAQVEPSLHAPAVRVPETPPLAHLKHTRAGYSFLAPHAPVGTHR